jgi:hypothetical protein
MGSEGELSSLFMFDLLEYKKIVRTELASFSSEWFNFV